MVESHKSTVYREISRNKNLRGNYNSKQTQMVSDEHKERFGRVRCFSPSMEKLIRDKRANAQWSPEQIVGYCKLSGIATVSHQRIYQFVRTDKIMEELCGNTPDISLNTAKDLL